jgi:hypothetical protein
MLDKRSTDVVGRRAIRRRCRFALLDETRSIVVTIERHLFGVLSARVHFFLLPIQFDFCVTHDLPPDRMTLGEMIVPATQSSTLSLLLLLKSPPIDKCQRNRRHHRWTRRNTIRARSRRPYENGTCRSCATNRAMRKFIVRTSRVSSC